MTTLKMADSAVLREKPEITLENVSAGEGVLLGIYKKIFSATQTRPFGEISAGHKASCEPNAEISINGLETIILPVPDLILYNGWI